MKNILKKDSEYISWLTEIKKKIQRVQISAAVKVNTELLKFYWELGADIVEKEKHASWGDSFINQLSIDLTNSFPGLKGFSTRNIKYIRQWYLFYNQPVKDIKAQELEIGQQAVAQIPWGHNIAIITKCKDINEAFFYVQKTHINNWSRTVLVHQIESGLYSRAGKAITNFNTALPKPMSELAQQTIKDPYIFDFMTLAEDHTERELEQGLIEHITHFLLELGAGFAYIGKQMPLQVGKKDFFVDLLFYHTNLHAYVVIELKTIDFEPEHAGKLNFYIKAIDEQLRKSGDNPTIGILLCKSKEKIIVEYALSDIKKPIGVSEYQLTQSLPENLKSSLPSIEDIEAEFSNENNSEKK